MNKEKTKMKNGDVVYWAEDDYLHVGILLNLGAADSYIEESDDNRVTKSMVSTAILYLNKKDALKEVEKYEKNQEKQEQEIDLKYRHNPVIKWEVSYSSTYYECVILYINGRRVALEILKTGLWYERRLAELKREMLAELETRDD